MLPRGVLVSSKYKWPIFEITELCYRPRAISTPQECEVNWITYLWSVYYPMLTSLWRPWYMTRGFNMMTSSNGNIFRVTDHLWGESTGDRWIPSQKAVTRRALVFSLIWAWTNGWVSNRYAGDVRHCRSDYDVTVMNWYNCLEILLTHTYIYVYRQVISCIKSIELNNW